MTTPQQPPSFQPYPVPPVPPRKRPRWLLPTLIGVGVVLVLCVGFGIIGAFLPDQPQKPKAAAGGQTQTATAAPVAETTTPPAPTTQPATAPPTPTGLTKADVILKVKIKKQECFGSAGCNLEFEIQADWPSEKIRDGQKYDVTYEVAGVEDGPQVGTLTIVSKTEFEQDSYQSAQTTRHVRTLKVKVTDVELQYGG